MGSQNSTTPNVVSFCDISGSNPEYHSVELGVKYGVGLNSRVLNSQAIGYVNTTSYIAKIIFSYPIKNDPNIEKYPTRNGSNVLHPKEDCLIFYDLGSLHFVEPNFDLAFNVTNSTSTFSIEEIDGTVTYLIYSGTSVFRIQEHSYLQNYSAVEEIDLGSNLRNIGFSRKNQVFGKFNRNAYDDMTTTFFDGNFNPLTIRSSVSLTFQRYHFSRFSRLEDKIFFMHQTFTGQPDEICTVPYTVDESSITLDWEG